VTHEEDRQVALRMTSTKKMVDNLFINFSLLLLDNSINIIAIYNKLHAIMTQSLTLIHEWLVLYCLADSIGK
jgi:hypothetical protein